MNDCEIKGLCVETKKVWHADGLAVAIVLAGLIAALAVGWASDGFYQDDDLTHYRFASAGCENLSSLLHRWARPGYNIPTALVARYLGMPGCRVFSAIQTAIVAFFAYAIARRLIGPGKIAALAAGLVWLQPMVFRLATTTLTETTAAVYITLGVWLFLRGNRIWSCAVISLTFVTRDETMALAPIMALAVLIDALKHSEGRVVKILKTPWLWACALALVWAPLVYWLTAWLVNLPPDASPLTIFTKQYTPEYGSGPAYWFLAIWPEAATIGIPALAIAGAWWLGRKGWLISAWVFGLVALHSLIFARGLFASGGYARFLVPIAGLMAVLASAGVQVAWELKRKNLASLVLACMGGWLALIGWKFGFVVPLRYMLPPAIVLWLWAILALLSRNPVSVKWMCRLAVIVAVVLAVGQFAIVTRPLMLADSAMHRVIIASVESTQASPYATRPALAQHVLIQHLRPGTAAVFSNSDAITKWQRAQPGTLFFWESKYCVKLHEQKSTIALRNELYRLGNVVCHNEDSSEHAIVFERKNTAGVKPTEIPNKEIIPNDEARIPNQ